MTTEMTKAAMTTAAMTQVKATKTATLDNILIDGNWVPAANGRYPVINPADESVAAYAPACSAAQVEEATKAARRAFDKGPWPRMSGAERAAAMHRAALKFREVMDSLLDITVAETGALSSVAAQLHTGLAATRLETYAGYAELDLEETVESLQVSLGAAGASTSEGVVVRDPVGVVACISPYNAPVVNCAGKIGPALALGNTVVVKPPPAAPMVIAEFCRALAAELPPGVVNYVSGPGPEIGETLVASPDIDMVSFTGSSAVGAKIQEVCARSMKRSLMELGGKSANIVFADSVFTDSDMEKALKGAMSVWTFHSGQICIAPTRLLVEESIYDVFTEKLAQAGAALKVGDPREPDVVVGPLISAAQVERCEYYVASALREGAKVTCGGKRPQHLQKGFYYEPTLVTHCTNTMQIAREEIFGPVITAIPFRDEAHAVAMANQTDYGLSGYIWSGDRERALRVARQLRTGTVQINGSAPRPDTPFGGFKRSGIGRDNGKWCIPAYTELKFIGWSSS